MTVSVSYCFVTQKKKTHKLAEGPSELPSLCSLRILWGDLSWPWPFATVLLVARYPGFASSLDWTLVCLTDIYSAVIGKDNKLGKEKLF